MRSRHGARVGRAAERMSHEGSMTARSADSSIVHLKLGALFGLLWLLTAFHLVVMGRHEVWPWGWDYIAFCSAPPLYPLLALATGNFAAAALFGAILAIVIACWFFAARRPERHWRSQLAAILIVAYWLFYDFGLAFAA